MKYYSASKLFLLYNDVSPENIVSLVFDFPRCYCGVVTKKFPISLININQFEHTSDDTLYRDIFLNTDTTLLFSSIQIVFLCQGTEL